MKARSDWKHSAGVLLDDQSRSAKRFVMASCSPGIGRVVGSMTEMKFGNETRCAVQ